MLMKSRWLRLLAVLLALTVFAVSCGNDDDDGPGVTAGTPAPAEEAPAEEAPAEEAPAEEAPAEEAPAEAPAEEPEDEPVVTIDEAEEVEEVEGGVPTGNTGYISGEILTTDCSDGRPTGGTLTIGMFGEIVGWDPTVIQGGASLGGTQMIAIYGALFYEDFATGQLIPGLAENISTEDNQVFTLTLREGITFNDGTPLDVDAFIWNVEHHQNPDIGSQSRAQADLIASWEKIDDYTIELTATSRNAVFPQIFASRMAWMMSPTTYQEGQDPETGLNSDVNIGAVNAGAGPFILESWVQDDQAVVVRNPNYFREGCPYLDSVVFKPIIEPPQRYNAFNAGGPRHRLRPQSPELAGRHFQRRQHHFSNRQPRRLLDAQQRERAVQRPGLPVGCGPRRRLRDGQRGRLRRAQQHGPQFDEAWFSVDRSRSSAAGLRPRCGRCRARRVRGRAGRSSGVCDLLHNLTGERAPRRDLDCHVGGGGHLC